MLTKGHSLTEALIALALSSLLLTGALSCQWFAQQRLQLSLQQLQAATLLSDLYHLLHRLPATQQWRQSCQQSCPLPPQLSQPLQQRIEELAMAQLPHLTLCLNEHELIVSWHSVSQATMSAGDCGASHFQQLRMRW